MNRVGRLWNNFKFLVLVSMLLNATVASATLLQLASKISAKAIEFPSLPDGTLVHRCQKRVEFTVKNTDNASHTWAIKLYFRDVDQMIY